VGFCLLCIVFLMSWVDYLFAMDSPIGTSRNKNLITAIKTNNIEMVKRVLTSGADPNARDFDENGLRLLNIAAAIGSKPIVELLLKYGAEIDAKSGGHQTALMEAASRGHLDIVSLLLQRGSDPSATDFDGFTALEGAAHGGHENIVALLLKKNPSSMAKAMAMTLAAYRGRLGVVKLLLDQGVSVDSRDYYGDTALITAARNGQGKIVKFLLLRGANHGLKSEQSHLTAQEDANANGHHTVAKILSSH
jgi:ankyrin repeat protein